MFSVDRAADLARVVVIIAAAVAAAPLIRRSANRRSTCLTIVVGIVLTLLPTALHIVQAFGWRLPLSLAILAKLDAPGFALILFGVVLSLRTMSRAGDELRTQNIKLQQEASTDFLTGLLNRRQADSLLDYGAVRARRSQQPLGFIMIDLDHFKEVNDTLGHQAGDAVLRHVASLLKSRMRGSDILARYGGEEFLVVLADANADSFVTLADDLRRLVEQTPAQYNGQAVPVTASFGVAISLVNTEDAVRECIGRADAAMYAAKALGRNRVISYDQSMRDSNGPAGEILKRVKITRRPTANVSPL